jgi:hypothetical protein
MLRLRRGEQRAQGVEHLLELAVVARLQLGNFAGKFTIGEGEPTQPHKCPHDFDRDTGGAFALEHVAAMSAPCSVKA